MASPNILLRFFAPAPLVFFVFALSFTFFFSASFYAAANAETAETDSLPLATAVQTATDTPMPDIAVPDSAVPDATAPDNQDPAVQAAKQEAARPKAVLLPRPNSDPQWEEPEHGFEYARFPAMSSSNRDMDIMVVRVDPAYFDFVIRAATMPGEQPRTLQDWAAKHNLAATINAGMYLPDGLTNTGYLRVGDHLNNPRMSRTFGALFLSEPLEAAQTKTVSSASASRSPSAASATTTTTAASAVSSQPSALLLDRSDPAFESLPAHYANAVQNYRMVNANRRMLWRPAPQEHAIAALGVDGSGRILLIHCREPVTGVDFATMALELPIDLRTLMYLEGGTHAGLYVRPGGSQLRVGRHPADFWTDGSVRQLLPNIIGVRAKNASHPKDTP